MTEDDESIDFSDKDFLVTSHESDNGTLYSIYIFGDIESPEQFIPAIEALMFATEEDVVVVHLSTQGGCVDSTDTFLFALENTSAKVVFSASGGVHSAGTLVLMHANEITLSRGFNALVHNGSNGGSGKFSDWRAAAEFSTRYMHKLFRESYAGFLTEQEIEDLIAGKDFWFDRDEFVARWCRKKGIPIPLES